MNELSTTRDARDADDAPRLHVVFKVAEAEYALPADVVLQMESYTGASPVPCAAPYVAGIVHLRSRVVPVIDLRARFGLPPRERTLDTRVVVGQIEGRAVALIADSAREVLRLRPSQMQPPPKLLDDAAKGFVRCVGRIDARLVMVLDFAKVIGEEPLDV